MGLMVAAAYEVSQRLPPDRRSLQDAPEAGGERWVCPAYAAELLGCRRRTVERMRSRGQLAWKRDGNLDVWVRLRDIEAVLGERVVCEEAWSGPAGAEARQRAWAEYQARHGKEPAK